MVTGSKKRGLGRGLDALLGDVKVAENSDVLQKLPVEKIQRGKYQPRRDIDPERLQELADSISAQGVVQPVVVRPVATGRYELIAGERRWRAAQLAGLDEVPVVIREINDQAAMAIGLVENIQREDLNPLEEADALLRLTEEFSMTHQQVADAVGKSRAAVSNLLRLVELQPVVKELLQKGELEMGHARALLPLKPAKQAEAARKVVEQRLTVRATEALVKRMLSNAAAAESKSEFVDDPDIRRMQTDLSERLGARVDINHGKTGKGKLVISYTSLEELEGVLEKIH